jgi:peptide/nickel transport system ATP-binding protein
VNPPAGMGPGPDSATLEASELTKHYPVRSSRVRDFTRTRKVVHAVEDVSLELVAGEVVALVGESGSGKSTIGRVLAQLEPATAGVVRLRGEQVQRGRRRLLRYRREVQIVFQDPFSSLNPIHSVGYHLTRPLRIHGIVRGKAETREQVASLLERVQLTPPDQFLTKFPHELSGGQRQRVAIARALAVNPKVLLADEPVSMLDVSIRLSILNLLAELTRRDQLALLYITHDIASARYFADRLYVMYAGRLVEGGSAEDVTQSPAHPYTQLLLSAAPNPDRAGGGDPAVLASGEAPSLIDPPSGCRFHPRCPHARAVCATDAPPSVELGQGRWAACWLLGGDPPGGPMQTQPPVDRGEQK